MSDFRGPLPLEDRDFAEVRRNVMSKIERRPVAVPLTLAAAAALALIIILLPQPRITVPPPHRAPVVRGGQAILPIQDRRDRLSSTQPVTAPVNVARKEVQRKTAGAPPPDTEITMNIETADPNVRIIWIAR